MKFLSVRGSWIYKVRDEGIKYPQFQVRADVAQPEEQRFRKPQVKGSSPFIGSNFFYHLSSNRDLIDNIYDLSYYFVL